MLPVFAIILACILMASSTLAMRWVVGRGGSTIRVQTMLFIGAAIPLLIISWAKGNAMPEPAIVLGVVAGSAGFWAGTVSLFALKYGKVGPTFMVVFMAAGGPILIGRLSGWDGPLTIQRWFGLGLAVVALAICTLRRGAEPEGQETHWKWAAFAFLALFLNTANLSCQKILSGIGLGSKALTFNTFYFLCGAVIGMFYALPRFRNLPRRVWRAEIFVGLGVGVFVAIQMSLILYAVDHLHAAIAFPTMMVLTLALLTLGGSVFFHERLRGREKIGIATACAALILINM